jgi:hypothetical protein
MAESHDRGRSGSPGCRAPPVTVDRAVADKTGDSKKDILNNAVMVYEVFVDALARGNGELCVVNPDGTQEVWRLMGQNAHKSD